MYSFILLALSSIPAGTKPVTIEGTVVDANGSPVAEASVIVADTLTAIGVAPEVYGRCLSDGKGHFSIPLPPMPEDTYGARHHMAVWAHKPDLALGVYIVPRQWPADGAVVSIALSPPTPLSFQVQGPGKQVLSGATLTIARAFGWPMPAPLAGLLQTKTDSQGRAQLISLQAKDIDVLRVQTPALDIQQLVMPKPESGTYRLAVAPAGRLDGRVTAADPQAVRGLKLHIRTWSDPSDAPRRSFWRAGEDSGVGGVAEVTTNDDGSFTVPCLAEGTLQIKFVPHLELPYRGSFEDLVSIEPGQTTKVEIPLKKAVRVRGQVLERGSAKPIPDALVRVDWSAEIPRARTDATGWYTAYIAGGSVTLHVPAPPPPYYYPQEFLDSQPVPAGSQEMTLKPVHLARGLSLVGHVTDESGKPVTGALVSAESSLPGGGLNIARAWSNRRGDFELPGVDPKADLRLYAQAQDKMLPEPLVVRAAEKKSVTLKLSGSHTFSLEGRVVDHAGRPLKGVPVQILSAWRTPDRNDLVDEGPVLFGNRREIFTDTEGRFRTLRWLRPDREYQAKVEVPRLIAGRTAWLNPAVTADRSFADVVLAAAPRPITVSGHVADQQGQPVRGALVFQSGSGPRRTHTKTDEHGDFQLTGVYEGKAFLFVECDGYRFRGFLIDATGKPMELVLHRNAEESAGTPLKTLPPVLPPEKERALLRQLLDPLVKQLTPEISARQYQLYVLTARGDPARALELADRTPFRDEDINEILRYTVAEGLLEQSPDESLAVAETLKEPGYRASLYLKASDLCSQEERARKLSLIHTAVVYGRASSRAISKLDAFGQAALRLFDLGKRDQAIRILREGQVYAQGLAKPNEGNRRSDDIHARGRFAAKLARIDAKAALELASGFSDPYHDWYFGGVALGLAENDPAEAERVLGKIRSGNQRESITERVCGRLAVKDPKGARALLEKLETPLQRLSGLSAMARTCAQSDPRAAASLLQEILAGYQKLFHQGRDQGTFSGGAVQIAALLPVAEQVGQQLLENCFWRAVSMSPPRPSRGGPDDLYEQNIARLAILLARYDREVARVVLEPAVLRLRSLVFSDREYTARPVFAAATAIDPAWAVRLLESIPDDLPGNKARPKDEARRTISELMTYGVKERWKHLQSNYAYIQEDSRDDER